MLTQTNSADGTLRSPAETLFDTLANGGALFFTELVRRSGLLPSQVEEALSQLAALGLVTSDSFDGLRALLVPSNKRPTFGRNAGKRRRKTNLASIEFAGRWSLLRTDIASPTSGNGAESSARDAAIEQFARVLLHRYGVVFRRLLERESLPVTWYELGRIYRRWEARAARFAAAILWEESAANNLPCLRPSACCVLFARRRVKWRTDHAERVRIR